MKNLDVDTSTKRPSVQTGTADVSGLVLEFFSGSLGKWISAKIIERDDTGAVQVDAKPGVWLSAKDCKRKLRARAYLDDASIGSTILPPDAFLITPDADLLTKDKDSPKALSPKALSPKALSPKVPSVARRVSALTSGSTTIGKKGAAQSVSAMKAGSINPSAIGGGCTSNASDRENKKAPRLAVVINAAEIADSRHACDTPKSDTTQEPSPKVRVVPGPASFRPSRRLTTGPLTTGPLTTGPPTTYGPPAGRNSFSCPRCGEADLPTFEIAVQHCPAPTPDQADKAAKGSQPATPRSSPTITDLPPGFQAAGRQRNGLRFSVGTVPVEIQKDELESAEKCAVEGFFQSPSPPVEGNGDVGGETDSTRSSEGRGPTAGALPEQPAAPKRPVGSLAPPVVGEAIAYDIRGNPIISRSVSSDTGAGVTTVINDDGTKCTFGKNTLASLMSSDATETSLWIDALSTLEMRGLVHEIGQVLLSTSKVYQFHLDRLKALSERSHYSFFGLTEDATDVEIDRAYKKLAKQMHPDKNGGTEEAKEAFQQMKEKYEALKERRASQEGDEPKRRKSSKMSEDDEDDADEICDEDTEGQSKEDRRKEAYDEDEEDEAPKKQESGQISYDPTDQSSLASTALEMLGRLKAIEGSMATVLGQLKQQGS